MMTRYGRLGASSRLRSLAYVPAFRAAGFEVEVSPLFDDAYVERLYDGRRKPAMGVARAYLARMRRIVAQRGADVLWVEKELLPYLPAGVDLLLARRFPRLVIDCDDAVFHRYDRHRSWLVRRLLCDRIDRLMGAADAVTAGSPYLAERARAAGARRVVDVPTTIDLERYTADAGRGGRAAGGPVRIGWIGTPRTARYLDPYAGAFEAVLRSGAARFVLIGAGSEALGGVPNVERRAWSEETEVADLASCDIGVMPLPDEPFERGKCGYKLVQFLALGKPVVASPVGVNATIVEPGTNGLFARDPAEWRAALEALIAEPARRRAMGAEGRRCVESRFSLQAQAPRLVSLLRELASVPTLDSERAVGGMRTRSLP
jgi:glycosyltransferase involved in cell wall biosynthesis